MAMSETTAKAVEEEVTIEMTSMIDVVFLLLIFFMVTMNFRVLEGRLESRLPKDMGQNAGGKPIDREQLRIRIQITKAKPTKLYDMVKKRKSYVQMFGKERLQDTEFHMKFSVGEAVVMRMVQKTVVKDKQPITTIEFFSGDKKIQSADILYRRLLTAYKQFPKMPVIIDPDRSATYAALIVALNAVTKVGFEEIKFSGKISSS